MGVLVCSSLCFATGPPSFCFNETAGEGDDFYGTQRWLRAESSPIRTHTPCPLQPALSAPLWRVLWRWGLAEGCRWHQAGADAIPPLPVPVPQPSVIRPNICKPKVPLSPTVTVSHLAFLLEGRSGKGSTSKVLGLSHLQRVNLPRG